VFTKTGDGLTQRDVHLGERREGGNLLKGLVMFPGGRRPGGGNPRHFSPRLARLLPRRPMITHSNVGGAACFQGLRVNPRLRGQAETGAFQRWLTDGGEGAGEFHSMGGSRAVQKNWPIVVGRRFGVGAKFQGCASRYSQGLRFASASLVSKKPGLRLRQLH